MQRSEGGLTALFVYVQLCAVTQRRKGVNDAIDHEVGPPAVCLRTAVTSDYRLGVGSERRKGHVLHALAEGTKSVVDQFRSTVGVPVQRGLSPQHTGNRRHPDEENWERAPRRPCKHSQYPLDGV